MKEARALAVDVQGCVLILLKRGVLLYILETVMGESFVLELLEVRSHGSKLWRLMDTNRMVHTRLVSVFTSNKAARQCRVLRYEKSYMVKIAETFWLLLMLLCYYVIMVHNYFKEITCGCRVGVPFY